MVKNLMELKEALSGVVVNEEYQNNDIMQDMLMNAAILAVHYRADWLAETPLTLKPVIELVVDYLTNGDVAKDFDKVPAMHFMGCRVEEHALSMMQMVLGFSDSTVDCTQLLDSVTESNTKELNARITVSLDYPIEAWLLYYPMYRGAFAEYGRSLVEAEQAAETTESAEPAETVTEVVEAAAEAVAEVAEASAAAVSEVVEASSDAVSSDEIADTAGLDAEVDAMVADAISSTPRPTTATYGGGSSDDGMSGLAIAGCVVAAAAAIYGGYRIMTDSDVDTTVVDLNDCW